MTYLFWWSVRDNQHIPIGHAVSHSQLRHTFQRPGDFVKINWPLTMHYTYPKTTEGGHLAANLSNWPPAMPQNPLKRPFHSQLDFAIPYSHTSSTSKGTQSTHDTLKAVVTMPSYIQGRGNTLVSVDLYELICFF